MSGWPADPLWTPATALLFFASIGAGGAAVWAVFAVPGVRRWPFAPKAGAAVIAFVGAAMATIRLLQMLFQAGG